MEAVSTQKGTYLYELITDNLMRRGSCIWYKCGLRDYRNRDFHIKLYEICICAFLAVERYPTNNSLKRGHQCNISQILPTYSGIQLYITPRDIADFLESR